MGRSLLLVCLGGAVGSGLRYLVSGWTLRWLGTGFPWGTLAVNVLGSFLLAALMEAHLRGWSVPSELRVTLAVGVLGGFTTYSTFNFETMRSLESGAWALAAANAAATLVGCLAAGVLGIAVGRWLAG